MIDQSKDSLNYTPEKPTYPPESCWLEGNDGFPFEKVPSHRIHVWYVYLHLVDFCGECR